jgi:uncharacterized membrane protein YciS (DUF1049 family)
VTGFMICLVVATFFVACKLACELAAADRRIRALEKKLEEEQPTKVMPSKAQKAVQVKLAEQQDREQDDYDLLT